MSSARLPLTLAVLGFAACAHTPTDSALSIANAHNAAPIVVVDAETIPEGFDEHVVMVIDQKGLERARRAAALDPNSVEYDPFFGYGYAYPARSPRRPVAVEPHGLPRADEAGIPHARGTAIRSTTSPQRATNRSRSAQP